MGLPVPDFFDAIVFQFVAFCVGVYAGDARRVIAALDVAKVLAGRGRKAFDDLIAKKFSRC